MQAITQDVYGPAEILQLRDIDVPVPDVDRPVLIRVRAASVNPYDWHMMTGLPYLARIGSGLRKPKHVVPGVDVAGVVEAVGPNVTQFKVGDEVFGAAKGSFAEYACARETTIAAKPNHVTFEQAAAIPIAGLTALQALRDKGGVQAGQHVLINGAAGGVGTFAVQIAKAFGAEVTGVCSTSNVDMVRSIGADLMIDYTAADFASGSQRYDVIIDNIGNRSLAECRKTLTRKGVYVIVGGPDKGNVLGPVTQLVAAKLTFLFATQKAAPLLAKHNHKDLLTLSELITSGKVTPVIDRTCTLSDVPAALRQIGAGHTRGKIVVAI